MNLQLFNRLTCLIILAALLGPNLSLAADGCQARCCRFTGLGPAPVSPAWALDPKPCHGPARADRVCRFKPEPGLAWAAGPNPPEHQARYPGGSFRAGRSGPAQDGGPGGPPARAPRLVPTPPGPVYLTLMNLLC